MASVQPEHFVAMKAMKQGKVKHFAGYLISGLTASIQGT